MARDDFTEKTKRILQERAGNRCSNPNCGCLTSGPNHLPDKATRIGKAAHITAASEGGPRFDSALTAEERSSILNGIWLCSNCATLIDADHETYPTYLLQRWKTQAEENARRELEGTEHDVGEQPDGYSCPYCDTFVKESTQVCVGCGAEVVHGLARHEQKQHFQTAAMFTGFFTFLIFGIPDVLNQKHGFDLPSFWGLPVLSVLPGVFVVALVAGAYWVNRMQNKARDEGPRFFRRMEN